MQGLEAQNYTGTWNCFTSIVKEDGILALWKGTTPRLSRVMFSGGIIFASMLNETLAILNVNMYYLGYEAIMKSLNDVWPEP